MVPAAQLGRLVPEAMLVPVAAEQTLVVWAAPAPRVELAELRMLVDWLEIIRLPLMVERKTRAGLLTVSAPAKLSP